LDTVAGIDTGLFYLLNTTLTASFLDVVMSLVSTKGLFVGVGVLAGGLSFVLGGKNMKWTLVLSVVVFFISDVTVLVLKELFVRTRPCHALEGVRVLAECSSSYSFPSRHAADIFAVMVLFGARYLNYAPAFLTAAFIVAWSRVYVGAHYPLDVLAGALLGLAIAVTILRLEKRFGVERLMEYVRKDKVS
jgi:undecaprenyl-diphosphatase